MAFLDSISATRLSNSPLIARLRASLGNTAEASATSRAALAIFAVRIVSAGLAYVTQILLARWMGAANYGIYAYVWTLVLMLGFVLDFGLSSTSQKLIPQYRASGAHDLLRGYQQRVTWIAFAACTLICLALASLVTLFASSLNPALVMPLYLGCAALPAYAAANIQDGLARAYDWMKLALLPSFIVRQIALIVLSAALAIFGFGIDATAAMAISAVAMWIAFIAQAVPLTSKLASAVEPGPHRFDWRGWLKTSLPLLFVEGFYLLLSSADILLLEFFRPAQDVGVYYAVTKTLILVSFIHYAMAASSAHRFSELHARGDMDALAAFLKHAIKLTFWPSLAATLMLLAIGKPLLALFGPDFTQGYALMFVLAIGLVVRSAIGPVERLLTMTGHQAVCGAAYCFAFGINVLLCVVLIPRYGSMGAAMSISAALIVLSATLVLIVKRRFGFRFVPTRSAI